MVEPLIGSCFLGHVGAVSLSQLRVLVFDVLARRSLVPWASGVVSRSGAVLQSRLGFLSVVTGYFGSCPGLSHILNLTWQWMITQVLLAVAYRGSLEIHPQSF